MIAEAAVELGRRIAGDRATGATSYWRSRHWDRSEAESDPMLGPEYVDERLRIVQLISERATTGAAALDIACGTGAFSSALLTAPIESLAAVDVSPHALSIARKRIGADRRASLVEGDFWEFVPRRPPDLILCVDALHHLGMPAKVLQRLRDLGRPGTHVIGNYWTGDHFHEFSRIRHGRVKHGYWSLGFLLAALFARASGTHPGQLRTAWLGSNELEEIIRASFSHTTFVHRSRYFLTFAAVV
jgi:SAM-dependent methyltransferase